MYLAGVTTPSVAYIINSYPNVESSTVTSLITMPGIFALFVAFCIGPLALKINKKYLLLFAIASTLVYFSVFFFVGARGPFTALLIAAGVLGISRGSGTALVNSIIGEFLEPQERAANIAICSAIAQCGSGLAAVIGGRIAAGNGGQNWPLSHALGFLSIPTMIVFAILMPKKPDEPETLPDVPDKLTDNAQVHKLPDPVEANAAKSGKISLRSIPTRVFVIIALHFVFCFSYTAYMLNSSVYIIIEHQLGTSADAGLISSANTVIAIVIGFSYRIWGKLLKKKIVPFAYALASIGFVSMLSITTSLAGIWIGAILLVLSMNLANPYIVSQIMSLPPPKLMPVALSLYMGCLNLSMFLAPYILRGLGGLLGGGVAGSLRVAAIATPCCVVAGLFLFTFSKTPKPQAG